HSASAMSAGPFKIATVLLMAALPVALFGVLSHGEARIAHYAARTTSPVPTTNLTPVEGGCLAGRAALPTCNSTAADPSCGYREVWAGGAEVERGDSR